MVKALSPTPSLFALVGIFLTATPLPALQRPAAPVDSLASISHSPPSPTTILAAGLPLRVEIDRRYRMRIGQAVEGHLIDPVYSVDHVVLPVNTPIYGKISGLMPAPGHARTWELLNGGFTPLKQPVLQFDSIQLPDGARLPISAKASERTASLIKMSTVQKKPSHIERAKQALHDKIESTKNTIKSFMHPQGHSDQARQILYGQLPYHPQDIWPGTQYDADLTQPLALSDPQASHLLPLTPPQGSIPPGTIEARLATPLSSATSKVDAPVEAVLTQPYLAPDKEHVILPEGTQMLGSVTEVKPARMLGRNGTLRFTFRQVKLPSGALERVHAQIAAVEGQKGQNISVDSEGGAHANADKGKIAAPLVLGLMAGDAGVDPPSGQGTGLAQSNGFGLAARILSVVFLNPVAVQGFAYYAVGQSITKRWLVRGHDVVFAPDTRMEMSIADR